MLVSHRVNQIHVSTIYEPDLTPVSERHEQQEAEHQEDKEDKRALYNQPPQSGYMQLLKKAPENSATFLLNVMGGCGAVWGYSEAAAVRAGENNDWWRVWSVVVGVLCAIHWWKVDVCQRKSSPDAAVLAMLLLQVVLCSIMPTNR